MDGNEVREYFVIVGMMKKNKKIKLLQEEGALLAEFRYTACPNQTSGIRLNTREF